jgi:hypothetical protein
MENILIRGHSILVKKLRPAFLLNQKGFIVPIQLYLDNLFGYFDDFVFMGSILKIKNSLDYLIFDRTGKILGISERLLKHLNSQYPLSL